MNSTVMLSALLTMGRLHFTRLAGTYLLDQPHHQKCGATEACAVNVAELS